MALLAALWPAPGQPDSLRIATYEAELSRRGPGLLYGAILKGDAQVQAVRRVIAEVEPDILLLTGFDYDADLVALRAFSDGLGQGAYPYLFALRPNTGLQTGLDMDGDGTLGGPGDAQGWGRFSGAGGMAILSRYPIQVAGARDFSAWLWRDFPGAKLPEGAPEGLAVQRLSTTGHWDVPVEVPGGVVHLLAFAATTPVFDGPEDRNGLRNQAEIGFWRDYLDKRLPMEPPEGRFVILGNANLDPADGSGRRKAIAALLGDHRLQDPLPASAGGRVAATVGQRGDPARDTADWPEPAAAEPGPGNLRVDYVLPSADLAVMAAGVFWPEPGAPLAAVALAASRHRLVWVDIRLP